MRHPTEQKAELLKPDAHGDRRHKELLCERAGNPVEHIVVGLGEIRQSIRHSMRGTSTKGCATGIADWITRGLRSGNISPHAAITSFRGISRHDA